MKRYGFLFVIIICMVTLIYGQDNSSDRADLIPDLMREINLWRLNSGLEPLVYNPVLEELAIVQADFLLEQGQINDFHAGRSGESPRERSQYPQYSWPTYGHPQLFAVTEIAALGSIESAMNFWTNSDIHTRSALNPTYREVGVAARQRGSDVLFIVVLGGQPNVLSALADPDTGDLYLTNERNDWAGDWIGTAIEYRLLASNLEPLSNWLAWEPRVDLPEVDEEFFYIQYQDGEKRVTYQVPVEPIWTLPIEERALAIAIDLAQVEPADADDSAVGAAIAALPTGTPTSTPTQTPEPAVFSTSTPIPSQTPVPSPTIVIPTLTPRPVGTVRIEYDDEYLTFINSSSVVVDLYGMTLSDGNFTFSSINWEVPADQINIGAVPPNHCLQLGGFDISNTVNPLEECSFIRSLVTISEENFFWQEGTFEVRRGNELIATCDSAATVCEFELD